MSDHRAQRRQSCLARDKSSPASRWYVCRSECACPFSPVRAQQTRQPPAALDGHREQHHRQPGTGAAHTLCYRPITRPWPEQRCRLARPQVRKPKQTPAGDARCRGARGLPRNSAAYSAGGRYHKHVRATGTYRRHGGRSPGGPPTGRRPRRCRREQRRRWCALLDVR